MECRYCGYEIPDGELYCGNCGKEVYAVPDYNPLEDMLSAQIKVGVSGKESVDTDYLYDLSDDIKGKEYGPPEYDRKEYDWKEHGRKEHGRKEYSRKEYGRKEYDRADDV